MRFLLVEIYIHELSTAAGNNKGEREKCLHQKINTIFEIFAVSKIIPTRVKI